MRLDTDEQKGTESIESEDLEPFKQPLPESKDMVHSNISGRTRELRRRRERFRMIKVRDVVRSKNVI